MSGDIFPLIIGFLIISLFLFSIEILIKSQSKQNKISHFSKKIKEKIK
jgi:hypothetical protein